MLCRRCRRQLPGRSPACLTCGTPVRAGAAVYELVLPGGERVSLTAAVTIGRGRHDAVRVDVLLQGTRA